MLGGCKCRLFLLNFMDIDFEIKVKWFCILVKEKDFLLKIGDEMVFVEELEFEFNVLLLYLFDVKFYICFFWDEDNDEWSMKGCKVNCC